MSRSAGDPGTGDPGPRFSSLVIGRSLSRRQMIGGAAAAGLGAPFLDPAVASAGQITGQQHAHAGQGFSPATAAVLQAIIASGAGAANLPGLAVGVWVPGQGSYVQAIGTGDLATTAPLRLGDHFRIASITKTFTATVILQLVDEKRISLSDHLATYIAGIPDGDQITIAQLLASGFRLAPAPA